MDKRRRLSGDDFFGFDREFERMREEMEKLMEGMMGSIPAGNLEKFAKPGEAKHAEKTGVYGFSIRIGPDGKPVIREFGNVKPEAAKEAKIPIGDEREPLIDVIEGKDEITVIAELPGVGKKDIRASGEGRELEIKVVTKERRYHKILELPATVDFANTRAKYNNGVLEIILEKNAKGGQNRKIEIA